MITNSDIAIEVNDISKRYRVGAEEDQIDTFLGQIINTLQAPIKNFKRLRKLRKFEEDEKDVNWALKEVSFQLNRGEILGVIGPNGAGKSTLLKVLSRITEPTSGTVKIKGRISSLLEVGTGFHEELTGRDNIYMNGTILGMTKKEIDSKFDEIVEFSGVERYIDTPVKFYSSGMKVRLGFSVAAHLEPEILLIDEVLAVGDVAFQKKCLGKMDEVSHSEGRTVLFVSHNMGMIRELCDRTIFLNDGHLQFNGDTETAISEYLADNLENSGSGKKVWKSENAPGSSEVKLKSLKILDQNDQPTDTVDIVKPTEIEIVFEVLKDVRGMRWIVQLITADGYVAFSATDHSLRADKMLNPGMYRSVCTIPENLLNKKQYYLKVHAGIPGERVLVEGEKFLKFTALGGNTHGSYYSHENWPGALAPKVEWKIDQKIESTHA